MGQSDGREAVESSIFATPWSKTPPVATPPCAAESQDPCRAGAPMSTVESFNAILKKAQELGASDVHVCAGGPFRMRLRGQMMPVAGLPPLTPDDTRAIASLILLQARKVPSEGVPDAVATLRD